MLKRVREYQLKTLYGLLFYCKMYKQFPHNPLTNLSRTFYKSMCEKWLDVLLYAHEHKCSSLFWCPKNVRENQIQIISMATRGIYILTNCIQKIFAPVLFSPLSPSFWAFWANSIVSYYLSLTWAQLCLGEFKTRQNCLQYSNNKAEETSLSEYTGIQVAIYSLLLHIFVVQKMMWYIWCVYILRL